MVKHLPKRISAEGKMPYIVFFFVVVVIAVLLTYAVPSAPTHYANAFDLHQFCGLALFALLVMVNYGAFH